MKKPQNNRIKTFESTQCMTKGNLHRRGDYCNHRCVGISGGWVEDELATCGNSYRSCRQVTRGRDCFLAIKASAALAAATAVGRSRC